MDARPVGPRGVERGLNMKKFSGGGLGGSAENKPDTYFSDDIIEVVLGLSEGPIEGLKDNSAKNFYVGETPLLNSSGETNFKNFELVVNQGSSAGEVIIPRLGGQSSSVSVNTQLSQNVAVIRQGQQTDIDWLELRFVIHALMKQTKEGSRGNSLQIKIEHKPSNEATWNDSVLYAEGGTVVETLTNGVRVGHLDTAKSVSTDARQQVIYNQAGAPTPTSAEAELSAVGRRVWWVNTTSDFTPRYYSEGSWLVPAGVTVSTAPAGRERAEFTDTEYVNLVDPNRVDKKRRIYYWTSGTPMDAHVGDLWFNSSNDKLLWFNGSAWVASLGTVNFYDPLLGLGMPLTNGILTINEKISSNAVREVKIKVDRIGVPYDIRVTKLTADSVGEDERADVSLESFQEVKSGPMQFPNLATAHLIGRATDQFSSLPQFSGIYRGRRVKVPSNYNPITRVYTGVWDGTWMVAYTDNPAYIGNDIIENDRYGLNSTYPVTIEPFDVYEAGVWCDQQLSSGKPAFTFNQIIQEPQDARELATYIFGIFGGRFFDDGNGYARLRIDNDAPAVHLFTKENVKAGTFRYSQTEAESRVNDYTVVFKNPNLFYKEDRRRVFDQDMIDTYGRVPDEFIAVGCNNADEAVFRTRAKMISGLTEVETVTFETAREGLYLEPYDVILVSDDEMDNTITGRIAGTTGLRTVHLRDFVYLEPGFDHDLVVNLNDFELGSYRISAASTGVATKTLTMMVDLPVEDLPPQAVFSIGLNAKPYRVMVIGESEGDNEELVVISALEVNRTKYVEAANGGELVDVEIPEFDTDLSAVKNLRVTPWTEVRHGRAVQNLRLEWDAHANKFVRSYTIRSRFNEDEWVYHDQVTAPFFDLFDITPGHFVLSVQANTILGRKSVVAFTDIDLSGDVRAVAPVQNITLVNETDVDGSVHLFDDVFAQIRWEPGESDPAFSSYKVEIFSSGEVLLRSLFVTAPEFTYTEQMLRVDEATRQMRVAITTYDNFGNASEPTNFVIRNPAPAAPLVTAVNGFGFVKFMWSTPAVDAAGSLVWVSTGPGINPGSRAPDYVITENSLTVPLASGEGLYARVAVFDTLGKTDLNYSAEMYASSHMTVDTVAPATPTGLAVTSTVETLANGTQRVKLNASCAANAETDLAGYIFEIKEGAGAYVGFSTNTNGYEWPLVKPGVAYTVRVSAFDKLGNVSAPSAGVAHTAAADTTAPGVPAGVVATGGFGFIALRWTANTDADLSHYEIYEHTASTPAPVAGTAATFTSASNALNITGLSAGTTRHYWVRAVDTSGNKSAWSTRVQGTTTLVQLPDISPPALGTPGVPSLSASIALASDGTTVVTMTADWTAGSNAVAYEIGITEGAGNEVIFSTGSLTYAWAAKAGVLYSVRVRAINGIGGKGAWTTFATLTPGGDTTAPGVPTGLAATPGFNTIWLSWAQVAAADLSHYEIYIHTAATPAPVAGTAATHSVRGTTFVHQGLANGAQRWYWVRAVDLSGNKSAWTASVNATTTTITIPDITDQTLGAAGVPTLTPTVVTDAHGNVSVQIEAVWTAATNAVSYEVGIKEGAGNEVFFPVGDLRFRFAGRPGILYTVRVRPISKLGAKGSWTTAATVTPAGDTTPPAAPTSLSAIAGLDTVWLSWVNPADTDFSHVEIFENTVNNSGTATKIGEARGTSASRTVSLEVTRYYWLKAVDTSGNKSAFGSVASATTGSIPQDIQIALESVLFTPAQSGGNRLTWTAGSIAYGPNGAAPTTQSISAGFVDWTSGTIYVYYAPGNTALSTSTSLTTVYSSNGLIVGIYKGGTNFQLVEGRAAIDGALILAQTIGASQLVTGSAVITGSAQIANAIIGTTHVSSISAAKLEAGTALAGSITVSGTALSTVTSNAALGAQDPATRINAASTQIDPGKILISGGSSLADWRKAGDLTKIDGGALSANTVDANKMTIGSRGIKLAGIQFEHNSPATNQVSWTTGAISYINDAGASTSVNITASSATWSTGTLYLYWVKDATTISTTTTLATAQASNAVILAAYKGGTDLVADYGRTVIDGAFVKTGTLLAQHIGADQLTAKHIVAGDTQNLIPNGDFSGGIDAWSGSASITAWVFGDIGVPSDAPSKTGLRFGTSATNQNRSVKAFPIIGGETYRIEWTVYRDAAATNYVDIRGTVNSADGTSLGAPFSAALMRRGATGDATVGWKTLSTTFVAPTNAATYSPQIFALTPTADHFFISKIALYRMNAAALIVNGGIIAAHVGTNEIIANAANIKDAIITSAKIVSLSAVKIEAGTALAGSITVSGRALNSIASTDILHDDVSEDWVKVAGVGTFSFSTLSTNVKTGQRAIVADPGPHQWFHGPNIVPFDPAKLYRVRFRVKRNSGSTGAFYLGVAGVAADRTTLVNINGSNTHSSQHYVVAYAWSQSVVPTDFIEYVGYIQGHGAPTGVLAPNTLASPAKMHADVRYLRPMAIFNYTSGDCEMVLDAVDIEVIAEEGAELINARSTQIDPGRILISGGSSLANWRKAGDLTKIDGGALSANTVDANKMTIGQRGVKTNGITFSTSGNTLTWTGGTVTHVLDNGTVGTFTTTGGSQAWSSGVIYVVYSKVSNAVGWTSDAATAFSSDRIVLATYRGGTDLTTDIGRTIIDGDWIKTGTIDAIHLKAGSVVADALAVGRGQNWLPNSDLSAGLGHFYLTGPGVTAGVASLSKRTDTYAPLGEGAVQVLQSDAVTDNATRYIDLNWVDPMNVGTSGYIYWACEAGKRYEFSAYILSHRCTGTLYIQWLDSAGVTLSYSSLGSIGNQNTNPNFSLAGYTRYCCFGTAPAGAVRMRVFIRKNATNSGSNSYFWVSRPMLGEAGPNQTEASPWANGATTVITPGNVATGTLQAIAATISTAWITNAHIVELDASKIKASTTLAGSITVSGRALGTVVDDTFHDDMSGQQWVKSGAGAGTVSYQTGSGFPTGNTGLIITGPAKAISPDLVPFDESKLYKVTFRVWKGSGSGLFYAGLISYDGANAIIGENYQAASGVDIGSMANTWLEYVAYIRGTSASGNHGSSSTIASPYTTRTGTKYVKPLVFANWTAGSGDFAVDMVRIEVVDENAAAVVNAGSTKIDPGKILISGATTLSNWIKAGDTTKIDGGQIAANTILANSAIFGLRGLAIDSLQFEHNSPSANSVSWTAGTITYTNDAGATVTQAISASNAAWTTGTLYIYYVQGGTTLSTTTTAATANAANAVILATYKGGTNLVSNYGRTIIDGSNIKTGTITATQADITSFRTNILTANVISATMLQSNIITAKHMVIGSNDNLVPNGDWADGTNPLDYFWTPSGSGTASYSTTYTKTGARSLNLAKTVLANSVNTSHREAFYIPVTPGEVLFGETEVTTDGTATSAGFYYRVLFYQTNKTTAATPGNVDIATNQPVGTSWTPYSKQITVPSDAAWARIQIYNHSTQTTTANFFIDRLVLRRANAASLIVNGTITGSHLDVASARAAILVANSVEAQHLAIGQRGISVAGLTFTTNSPSANKVAWTSGSISYINDAGTPTTASITASNATWSSGTLYLYWVKGATTISSTATLATAMGTNNVILASYKGGDDLVLEYGGTTITGNKVKTGIIESNNGKMKIDLDNGYIEIFS